MHNDHALVEARLDRFVRDHLAPRPGVVVTIDVVEAEDTPWAGRAWVVARTSMSSVDLATAGGHPLTLRMPHLPPLTTKAH